MNQKSNAWLVSPLSAGPFAVSECEVVHYQPNMQLQEMPFTVPHCHSLCFWKEKWVPVFDLSETTLSFSEQFLDVVILAYQRIVGESIEFLAIAVSRPPQRIVVDDVNFVEDLSEINSLWSTVADSAFATNDSQGNANRREVVPIISVNRMAGKQFQVAALKRFSGSKVANAHLPYGNLHY